MKVVILGGTLHRKQNMSDVLWVMHDLAPYVMRNVDGVIGYVAVQEASARW